MSNMKIPPPDGPLTRFIGLHRVAKSSEESKKRSKEYIHASELGGCPLSNAFSIIGLSSILDKKQGPDAKLQRIFDHGHAIHGMIQGHLVESGLCLEEDLEILLIIKSIEAGGSADAIIRWEGRRIVVEIKSMNSNKVSKIKEPEPNHKLQAATYLIAGKEAGIIPEEEKQVLFIYYGKDTSEVKEFWYTVTPKDIQQVHKKVSRIRELIDDIKLTLRLPKPEFDKVTEVPCRWCNWTGVCFDAFQRIDVEERLVELVSEKPNDEKQDTKQKPKRKAKLRIRGLSRSRSKKG